MESNTKEDLVVMSTRPVLLIAIVLANSIYSGATFRDNRATCSRKLPEWLQETCSPGEKLDECKTLSVVQFLLFTFCLLHISRFFFGFVSVRVRSITSFFTCSENGVPQNVSAAFEMST